MSKSEIIDELNQLNTEIVAFRRTVNSLQVERINRKEIKDAAKDIAQIWFEKINPYMSRYAISSEIIKKYDASFRDMIKLSFKRNRKKKYLRIINLILEDYNEELVLSLIEAQDPIIGIGTIQTILENSSDVEEDYLKEAIGCAKSNFLRASIVMAWNACVHRLQRVVHTVGYSKFNEDSDILNRRTDRRYRIFNRRYSITQFYELGRMVSDTHLLKMMEYWEFIDSNQSDRLFTCYTMRCNSAHPGEAVITIPNFASFYSDLKTMIFDNGKILSVLGISI